MEKEENIKTENKPNDEKDDILKTSEINGDTKKDNKEEDHKAEKSPKEKIIELEDKIARTFAEMENQRRRFEKEALRLIDNLERSKQILENDETLKNSEALKKTLEHFDIITKDLISIFSKNQIKPIDSLNKKLDPNLHQAMMEIEDNNKEPGTIVQEIQKGFTIKDRLLRPALVGVSKKTLKNDEKNQQNEENLEDK